MKKIIVLLVAALFFVACKDTNNGPTNSGYPTDGLALPETKSALMIGSYSPVLGLSLVVLSATAQDLYPGQLNYFSVVASTSSPLYNGLTDSISLNQPLFPAPSVYLNEGPLDLVDPYTSIEKELNRRPVASVNHAISQNDTAWVIDNKVKFWRDTIGGRFYIETYLASSMIAANYQSIGINLQTTVAPGITRNQDTVSVWDIDILSQDSSSVLFKKDAAYYHPMILSSSANPDFAWGFSISDYTPFGGAFSINDIVGTETTPIRHYILKPDSDIVGAYSPGFEFIPTFITVIWALNVETAKFEYINSVSTTL